MEAAAGEEGRESSADAAGQQEVERAGGRVAAIAVEAAVTDGNMGTAPAWPAHPQWLAQFFKLLDK